MCIREYLIIIWYGFKLYVVEKKHFTTSQHFFQQTRSFRWSGTKFWCFLFFFGFLTIFDSFILTRLQGLPTNRKGFTTFGWDPRMDLPNSFHCKKNDVFPVLLLQLTGCKKQEIPAKFGHLCKAKLELLVPFFPCHYSITPRSMAVGPSWASPKCLANQVWTLKFCCFGWDGKSASFVMLKGLRKIWFDPFTVGIYDIHDIIFACKRQKWSLSSLHI